jgi:hypothetical protein
MPDPMTMAATFSAVPVPVIIEVLGGVDGDFEEGIALEDECG